jgi:hypothetical protein
VVRAQGLVDEVRLIQGDAQTDFMINGVDKATSLQVLLHACGRGQTDDGEKPLALAVGDTESDLPMLRLARIAFAPANADSKVRAAGVEIAPGACQQGLAQAVARLLGHYPGACPTCSLPPLDRQSELLFAVLSAQTAERWGKVLHAGRLARLLMQA